MAPLGPFEPAPALALAVSGGADSMALALLASRWARARGGRVLALVVDHRLRRDSAAEAALTRARLAELGIPAEAVTLAGLRPGPALAARARAARHAALQATAARHGMLHLLFGHHAGDQAETVAMRRLAGSGPAGLAGMAGVAETESMRLLRPLLDVAPGRLRATLRQAEVSWAEDPSNRNPAALRARLRAARGDAAGDGVLTRAAVAAAAARGGQRARAGQELAAELAARVRLHPEAYAVVAPEFLSAEELAELLRVLAGAPYAPAPWQAAALAAAPRPATLGGVRIGPAGRCGPGWLFSREEAAMAPPVPAEPGARWDGRFRLTGTAPAGCRLGALGAAAAGLRRLPRARALPAAVLRTLPALWRDAELVAVPHLLYPDPVCCRGVQVRFAPASPMACAPFGVGGRGEGRGCATPPGTLCSA